MDLVITRSTTNRAENVITARTDAGRAFMAKHFGAGAVSATFPRENLSEVLDAIDLVGCRTPGAYVPPLQWSRARGTSVSDA